MKFSPLFVVMIVAGVLALPDRATPPLAQTGSTAPDASDPMERRSSASQPRSTAPNLQSPAPMVCTERAASDPMGPRSSASLIKAIDPSRGPRAGVIPHRRPPLPSRIMQPPSTKRLPRELHMTTRRNLFAAVPALAAMLGGHAGG
jgi:hypothetical protein